MHEWALAEAIISTALKEAKKEKLKEIVKLKINVGELQQIDIKTFEFILKEIIFTQSPIMRNMEIEIKPKPAILKCRICQYKWNFKESKKLDKEKREAIHFIPELSHVYMRCPKCRSPDFEIVEGRGVWVDAIEGIK
jgi:hydrogenase nickel incorporation protein HypA/HybF